jgi:hypothetical protein
VAVDAHPLNQGLRQSHLRQRSSLEHLYRQRLNHQHRRTKTKVQQSI